MSKIALRPSYWASVSGGKDSLYMLYKILENPKKYPLDGVVHFELEIDYPFVKDVIDRMEKMCSHLDIPFLRIKPRKSWYELYKKYGFPTRKVRWCNGLYKLDCKKQLAKILADNGKYIVWYIGYCVDEDKRYKQRNDKCERYPLVEENIVEDEVWGWAKPNPIFNNYYKFNKRLGCMFCVMSSMSEQAYLLFYYPEKYFELMRLAKQTEFEVNVKTGRAYSIWSSNSKYNTEYRMKRIETKYLPELIKQIELEEEQITFW